MHWVIGSKKKMNKQKGNTLAIIMILLVIITITGSLAIRQSLVSLGVATNSQAQQLLLQNSDAALFSIENKENTTLSISKDAMFGLIDDTEYVGKELVFCYLGDQATFFKSNRASLIGLNSSGKIDNSEFGSDGFCKIGSTSNFFTSGRKVVMTQIYVSYPDTSDDNVFEGHLHKTDPESSNMPSKPRKVIINAVSLMPSLSTASSTDINDCLSKKMSNSTDTTKSITSCLTALNVPTSTFTTEYILGPVFA